MTKPRPKQRRLAVDGAQLKIMSFGPRREIIAALANDADLSARELGERLKRPVTGLYRHLDLLLEARLIRQSGQRPGPKRPEVLYALTFDYFSTSEVAKTAEGRAAVSQAATRYVAATARKFSRAIEKGTARLYTEDANATYQVLDLQLDRAGLVQFHKLLRAFVLSARQLRVRGKSGLETVSMTIVVAPEG
jgi:DNA-binding transcriptional ArsR family regulator